MTPSIFNSIVIVVAAMCITAAAFAIETAFLSVSLARVEELAKEKSYGAVRLLRMLDKRQRYVNLLTLLWMISATFTVAFVFPIFLRIYTVWLAIIVDTVLMTIANYIVIGIGSRTLGRVYAYTIARIAAGPIALIATMLSPIVNMLIWVGNILTLRIDLKNGLLTSETELREIVDLAQEGGTLDDQEHRMIQAVFDLSDTTARSVMIPRTEMIWIEGDKTIAQVLSLAVRSGHSRIPVIGKDLDDILGVLYVKDILNLIFYSGASVPFRDRYVHEIIRSAQFIPDSKPLDGVLKEMQANHMHMAILVNEYGSIAGLVTIEDIVEEILGEIADEHDGSEIAPVEEYEPGKYRVSARLSLEDLGKIFDIDFTADDVDTVGGLVALKLGRVPLPGVVIEDHGLLLETEGGKDRRGRVKVVTILVERMRHEENLVSKERTAKNE